ncbi:tetratricopeptide repeat protein [Aureispira anguillae]|uniref:Tetratricopeptide repeat protein n=1 Tax=Aureispira anguillae TaxID=2864201 RepID=A0A916DVM2_9BACT|nr:tetratricopeptide repeat protein [Aureispira anguillae]BDS14526.1 tetratricopeptide repeat protein [Aureispira anguillae]
MIRLFLFSIALLIANQTLAQTASLARKYFSDGEFEKAAALYKELHERNRANDYFFERYFVTLLELEDYKESEKMIKKSIKAAPEKVERYVSYGILYERQGNRDKANEQYAKAIKLLAPNQVQVVKLANAFIKNKGYQYAVETYEKGSKLMKIKNMFAYEMGSVYRLKGDIPKMIESYLNCLEYLPNRMTNIQAFFQRELSKTDGFSELKKQLYARINKLPEVTIYPVMLIWVFEQQGDFENALRQAKALDKRQNENGNRIYRLAQTAIREKSYDAGIDAYNYIIEEKGIDSPYYIDSKRYVLIAKRDRLVEGFKYTREELLTLEAEYEAYINEFGRSYTTAGIMQEMAELQAFYLNDLDKAIVVLEEVIKMPQLSRIAQAEAKIDLGDYYLMQGEVWESTLLYSQVDKEMKDAPLGEMARYKNAKLSYYKGDFEWAQDQLDILKGSTSELISNDAIGLSVFILDHYALDTTAKPMQMFAKAELLMFQNKFDESIVVMDSILEQHAEHGLGDDILFAKSNIAYKKRDYTTAIKLLEDIPVKYKDGILVDNALFRMAEIYEQRLGDSKKAMELYEKILFEHSGSLFIVEARKRFRKLRGDGV